MNKILIAATVGLLAAACSPQAADTTTRPVEAPSVTTDTPGPGEPTSSSTPPPSPTATSEPAAAATPTTATPTAALDDTSEPVDLSTAQDEAADIQQVTVDAQAWHPNGDQIQVLNARFVDGHLELDVRFVAAGIDGISVNLDLDDATVYLSTEDGSQYQASDVIGNGDDADLTVDYAHDEEVTLVFPAPSQTEGFTLTVGEDEFASAEETFGEQIFVVGPFALASSPQVLPPTLVARDEFQHANASALRLDGLGFTDTRIGLRVTITNGFPDDEIHIEDAEGTYLTDDLGTRYGLIPPSGEPGDTTIPAGSAVGGILSFGGRIDPAATSLALTVNGQFGGEEDYVNTPTMMIDNLLIGGSSSSPSVTAAALPDLIALNESILHANGTEVRVREISFQQDTMTVPIDVTNGFESDIELNDFDGSTILVDDVGNTYRMLVPADNPDLTVASGAGLQGDLLFSGQIAKEATTVTLIFNEDFGGSQDYEIIPRFDFGPYPLTRGTSPDTPVAPVVFAVPDLSVLTPGALGSSATEEVELIVSSLNGVDRGNSVVLTLAEEILFDYDSAELRPDAANAVAQVAEVLEYYDGEPTTVVGHTDSHGSDAYNKDLSQRRAQAVVAALTTNHGVDAGLLTAEGRGEAEPVADNEMPDGSDDPQGRQKNRRVEIVIDTDRGLPGEGE